MFYRLNDQIALRKWKYVDGAIYKKGVVHAFGVPKEDFDMLLLCDGSHELEPSKRLKDLYDSGYIEECSEGERPSDWSLLKEYDNYYFPTMNLMITGKCNLNCLHCFNAKDCTPDFRRITMKYELTNGTLTFYLEGELNSLSSDGVEKEIDALIEQNEFQSLALDMKDLRYMSSAGIRVVMRLKQQYNDIFLNNMPDSVYEVFLMVGLANMFDIRRLSK